MKILTTADIHGSQYRLNIILGNIERLSPDLVIICGDITQFGPGDTAKNFLDQISVETFALTGNIDTYDVEEGITKSRAININKKRIVKDGVPFVGINGVDKSQTNNFFMENANIVDKETILITHLPPYGIQDKVFFGIHSGSKIIREIVDNYQPRLVLCGHIHEDPGFSKIDNTTVVNCSMGKRGEGAYLEINKKISIKMLD